MEINITHDFRDIENDLYDIQKPGRYIGGELNQVVKSWNKVKLHFALVFPDIYDVGQPNLGLAILYDILNSKPEVLAERAYAPWYDMEELLRKKNIPLFTLESKKPLKDFDIIGFTLPYETIYTNVINILDLSKIPLLSKDRSNYDPLIIAGGQATFNPEPMADFIDAFVIGEGEEVVDEVVEIYNRWKLSQQERNKLKKSLSKVRGVYVPEFYEIEYQPNNTIKSIRPITSKTSFPINKRITPKLPPAVTKLIVPNVEVVHDRISIEIMRGCTRGCRFCHAGMVNRPIRERTTDEILKAIDDGIRSTGYEQVGILSLSSSDHSDILNLVDQITKKFKNKNISVTLPSLRIESFSVGLMDKLKEMRPGGGFTIAPEAATERLRNIINKSLKEEDLIETVKAIFEHGWLSLKLYFMIGLPYEELSDVQAIIDLTKKILYVGRKIKGNRIRIHVGVSTFIPKPHTSFQWAAADSYESIATKINLLRDGFRKTGIKLSVNKPEESILETWLTRGDRKLGKVILKAWEYGAKFDAWSDKMNIDAWMKAFDECKIDPYFYSHRLRDENEIFPWDHISSGVNKNFLLKDYQWSSEGKTRPDCRDNCYFCGITNHFDHLRKNNSEIIWSCP